MYQCSDGLIFDESSQQCLIKVSARNSLDQFAALPSNDRTQIQKIANFFLNNPILKEEPTLTEPSLIQKLFNEVLSLVKIEETRDLFIEIGTSRRSILVEWLSSSQTH